MPHLSKSVVDRCESSFFLEATYHSCTFYFFFTYISDKLLIVSGGVKISDNSSSNLKDGTSIEIFNSDFSLSNCKAKQFLDLPPREKAFGGQIGENYVICGGRDYNDINYDTCFSISNSSGELNKTYSKMQIPRYGAASVVLNNALYISGGGIGLGFIRCNESAEIIQYYKSGFVEDLKQPLGQHCAVTLK